MNSWFQSTSSPPFLYITSLWWLSLFPCRWDSSSLAWMMLQPHWQLSPGRYGPVATTLCYGGGKTHRATAGRERRSRSPPQTTARSVRTHKVSYMREVSFSHPWPYFWKCSQIVHYIMQRVKESCSDHFLIWTVGQMTTCNVKGVTHGDKPTENSIPGFHVRGLTPNRIQDCYFLLSCMNASFILS